MKMSITCCDRCGREIRALVVPKSICTVKHTLLFGLGPFDYSEHSFELCKECTGDFIRFIEGGELSNG